MDDYENLLIGNEIFKERTIGVGVLAAEVAYNYGVSGPIARGSNIDFDVRKDEPYLVYDQFDFEVHTGPNGDCFDRFWVLLHEVYESARIVEQAIEGMPVGSRSSGKVPRVIQAPEGEVYVRTENPLGELGYYLISDGDNDALPDEDPDAVATTTSRRCPYVLEGHVRRRHDRDPRILLLRPGGHRPLMEITLTDWQLLLVKLGRHPRGGPGPDAGRRLRRAQGDGAPAAPPRARCIRVGSTAGPDARRRTEVHLQGRHHPGGRRQAGLQARAGRDLRPGGDALSRDPAGRDADRRGPRRRPLLPAGDLVG